MISSSDSQFPFDITMETAYVDNSEGVSQRVTKIDIYPKNSNSKHDQIQSKTHKKTHKHGKPSKNNKTDDNRTVLPFISQYLTEKPKEPKNSQSKNTHTPNYNQNIIKKEPTTQPINNHHKKHIYISKEEENFSSSDTVKQEELLDRLDCIIQKIRTKGRQHRSKVKQSNTNPIQKNQIMYPKNTNNQQTQANFSSTGSFLATSQSEISQDDYYSYYSIATESDGSFQDFLKSPIQRPNHRNHHYPKKKQPRRTHHKKRRSDTQNKNEMLHEKSNTLSPKPQQSDKEIQTNLFTESYSFENDEKENYEELEENEDGTFESKDNEEEGDDELDEIEEEEEENDDTKSNEIYSNEQTSNLEKEEESKNDQNYDQTNSFNKEDKNDVDDDTENENENQILIDRCQELIQKNKELLEENQELEDENQELEDENQEELESNELSENESQKNEDENLSQNETDQTKSETEKNKENENSELNQSSKLEEEDETENSNQEQDSQNENNKKPENEKQNFEEEEEDNETQNLNSNTSNRDEDEEKFKKNQNPNKPNQNNNNDIMTTPNRRPMSNNETPNRQNRQNYPSPPRNISNNQHQYPNNNNNSSSRPNYYYNDPNRTYNDPYYNRNYPNPNMNYNYDPNLNNSYNFNPNRNLYSPNNSNNPYNQPYNNSNNGYYNRYPQPFNPNNNFDNFGNSPNNFYRDPNYSNFNNSNLPQRYNNYNGGYPNNYRQPASQNVSSYSPQKSFSMTRQTQIVFSTSNRNNKITKSDKNKNHFLSMPKTPPSLPPSNSSDAESHIVSNITMQDIEMTNQSIMDSSSSVRSETSKNGIKKGTQSEMIIDYNKSLASTLQPAKKNYTFEPSSIIYGDDGVWMFLPLKEEEEEEEKNEVKKDEKTIEIKENENDKNDEIVINNKNEEVVKKPKKKKKKSSITLTSNFSKVISILRSNDEKSPKNLAMNISRILTPRKNEHFALLLDESEEIVGIYSLGFDASCIEKVWGDDSLEKNLEIEQIKKIYNYNHTSKSFCSTETTLIDNSTIGFSI